MKTITKFLKLIKAYSQPDPCKTTCFEYVTRILTFVFLGVSAIASCLFLLIGLLKLHPGVALFFAMLTWFSSYFVYWTIKNWNKS
jgi:hypothetical protein